MNPKQTHMAAYITKADHGNKLSEGSNKQMMAKNKLNPFCTNRMLETNPKPFPTSSAPGRF